MTTLSDNNALTEQISIPEIYRFKVSEVYTFYTSWPEDIEINTFTYLSRPLKRNDIQVDTQMGKTTVDITCSIFDFLKKYIVSIPGPPVEVKISKISGDDYTQQVVIFEGNVKSVSFKDNVVVARCVSNSSILDTIIPRFICKPTCNHQIFDDNCGLNQDDYEVTLPITEISGSDITVDGLTTASSYPFDWGYVYLNNDYRMITAQDDDVLTLHLPFIDAEVGDTAVIVPGCTGEVSVCSGTYDNFDNFLGMTSIPQKNPIIYGI